MSPVISALLKQLDRLVTETSGADSYLAAFLHSVSQVVNVLPESAHLSLSLAKKFKLVAANAHLKLLDYEEAGKMIESCC